MTSFFCCSRCQSLRQALILWASVRHSAANAEDLREAGSIPGLGRSPGGRYGSSLQYCLENALDEGAWQALVHRAAERSDTTEAAYHAAQRRLSPEAWWSPRHKRPGSSPSTVPRGLLKPGPSSLTASVGATLLL